MILSPPELRRKELIHAQRNLNPHKSACVAMILYNERYAAQRGGSMDFWDSLTKGEKRNCRECVEQIEKAPAEAM